MYCERPAAPQEHGHETEADSKNPGKMHEEFMPNGMRRLETAHFDHSASLKLNLGKH